MPPQKTTTDLESESLTYKCSICSVKYSEEVLVRAHMALAEDSEHQNRNGFMPEDIVEVYSEDNQLIEEKKGKDNQHKAHIDTENLPDGLKETDKYIIKSAVRSTNVDTYQELVDRTNAALRAEGLEELSYTTISNRLKEFFHIDGVEDTISFDDLSEKQKQILEIYKNNPEKLPSEIAEEANVESSYPNPVIEKYGHLVEENKKDSENKEVNEEDLDLTTLDGLLRASNESSVYDGLDLTDKKKGVVEYIARNPGAKNKEVSEATDCSVSYPSRIRDNLESVIKERAKELGKDADNNVRDTKTSKKEKTWESLKPMQKGVLRRLSLEVDPMEPESTYKEIAKDLDFKTYDSYISDVKSKYGEFAVRLKAARRKSSENSSPEEIVDEISIEEANKILSDFNGDLDERKFSSDEKETLDSIDMPDYFRKWLVNESKISNKEELVSAIEDGNMIVLSQLSLPDMGRLSKELGVMPPQKSIQKSQEIESLPLENHPNKKENSVTKSIGDSESSTKIESEVIDMLIDFVQYHQQLAKREIEVTNHSDSAAGRLLMAEEVESEIIRLCE